MHLSQGIGRRRLRERTALTLLLVRLNKFSAVNAAVLANEAFFANEAVTSNAAIIALQLLASTQLPSPAAMST